MTTSSDNLSVRNGILPNELYFAILDELNLPIRVPSHLTATRIFSYDPLGMDKVCTVSPAQRDWGVLGPDANIFDRPSRNI